MATEHHCVTPVAMPVESAIARVYETVNLADAYSITLPIGTTANAELLARFIFSQQSPWMTRLMKIRDALVAGLGLKTSGQLAALDSDGTMTRIGIFKIYSATEHEIVLGEDDKHLDFRLSVLCSGARHVETDAMRLVLSTVVHCHNRFGRIYIFLIAPFHRWLIQAILRRAARTGWPQAS